MNLSFMKPFNIESMDNKNNNVKNYIEQGKELKSGQIASSHLINTLEIYGFIPVKTGRIIYNEIIDIHPRIDTFAVYSNRIVSDSKALPYYKKISYNQEDIECDVKYVYSPNLNYDVILKCLSYLDTGRCNGFKTHDEAIKYISSIINNNIVVFKTESGENEQVNTKFHLGNKHQAFHIAPKGSFVMYRQPHDNELGCFCFEFQVLCRYVNHITGNVSYLILDPSEINIL